jgi:hypothetical protein
MSCSSGTKNEALQAMTCIRPEDCQINCFCRDRIQDGQGSYSSLHEAFAGHTHRPGPLHEIGERVLGCFTSTLQLDNLTRGFRGNGIPTLDYMKNSEPCSKLATYIKSD